MRRRPTSTTTTSTATASASSVALTAIGGNSTIPLTATGPTAALDLVPPHPPRRRLLLLLGSRRHQHHHCYCSCVFCSLTWNPNHSSRILFVSLQSLGAGLLSRCLDLFSRGRTVPSGGCSSSFGWFRKHDLTTSRQVPYGQGLVIPQVWFSAQAVDDQALIRALCAKNGGFRNYGTPI